VGSKLKRQAQGVAGGILLIFGITGGARVDTSAGQPAADVAVFLYLLVYTVMVVVGAMMVFGARGSSIARCCT
jgi:hypothetical protein